MEFADLNLSYGYPIQMQVQESDGQKRRYFCRFIGCVQDSYLLLSHLVTGSKESVLQPGDRVVARLMVGTGIVIFPVVVDHVQKLPQPMLYVEYPRRIEFKSVRGAERIDVGVSVQVHCADDTSSQTSGSIKDISLSGARLSMAQPIADVDTKILLVGKFPIRRLSPTLSLPGIIRTRISSQQPTGLLNKDGDNQGAKPSTFGVEFSVTDEPTLLSLYAYVYCQLAHQYLPKL